VELDTPTTYTFWGTPFLFAACRYAGQDGILQRVGNPRLAPIANRRAGCQPAPQAQATKRGPQNGGNG
jgi:hypothetical protein